ncbi:MAG: hypothetical protein ACJAVV_003447 [Alphaproteobacteria bacterium]
MITVANLIGKQKDKARSMFTWPSNEAENEFVSHPQWPEIKALRKLGWDELKIATSVVTETTTLRFKAEKFYTIAITWFNPRSP